MREPLLTIEEVAEQLHIGISTAYRLTQQSRIEHIRIAGRRMVRQGAVDEYLRVNTVPAIRPRRTKAGAAA